MLQAWLRINKNKKNKQHQKNRQQKKTKKQIAINKKYKRYKQKSAELSKNRGNSSSSAMKISSNNFTKTNTFQVLITSVAISLKSLPYIN